MIRHFYTDLPAKLIGTVLRIDFLSGKESDLLIKVLESKDFTQLDKYQTCQAVIAALVLKNNRVKI